MQSRFHFNLRLQNANKCNRIHTIILYFIINNSLFILVPIYSSTLVQLLLLKALPAITNLTSSSEREREREMEFSDHGVLEELLALRRENRETMPTEMNQIFSGSNWIYDSFNENPATIFPNSFYEEGFSAPIAQDFNYNFNEVYCPCPLGDDQFSAPQLTDSSMNTLDTPPFPVHEEIPLSIMEDEEPNLLAEDFQNLEMQTAFKVEPIHDQSPEFPLFEMGSCLERKNRSKKLEGQPSKNLMAERRRRKRLNDRLSMLRSIVPKISKMDRTSILADTIDYMKELLEKISSLQLEIEADSNHLNTSILKDGKPNETLVRNSPKFEVERRNMDTRIEICCAGKPGLLLSTVTTLESLGLEVQQCVISCFNDFSMQASCSEEKEQKAVLNSEDIKQALFRNAGYGGSCP